MDSAPSLLLQRLRGISGGKNTACGPGLGTVATDKALGAPIATHTHRDGRIAATVAGVAGVWGEGGGGAGSRATGAESGKAPRGHREQQAEGRTAPKLHACQLPARVNAGNTAVAFRVGGGGGGGGGRRGGSSLKSVAVPWSCVRVIHLEDTQADLPRSQQEY